MKTKTSFVCTECKATYSKWLGQCTQCKEWSTVEEQEVLVQLTGKGLSSSGGGNKGYRASKVATGNSPQPINKINQNTKKLSRIKTDIKEFDRVVGGGMVPGGVTLLSGEPGVGKSSIVLAVAAAVAKQGLPVLYITGEETAEQVAARAARIGAGDKITGENLLLLAEGNLQNSLQAIYDTKPELLIMDSIQTFLSDDSESRVGSITQVTEVCTEITNLAKKMNIPTLLVGHVTKDGNIAGPRVVEHLVDVVLFFESSRDSPLRLLRARKNRYGATDEIGCFEHTSEGLVSVEDPSGYFTSVHMVGTTGFATTITMEGIRALPIELQALVAKTRLPNPRKITQGIEHGRALQIQAVLDRYVKLNLDAQDVYVATTGGLRIQDSSTDLAVAAAIVSSAQDIAIPSDCVFIGEVSLTGEIRSARERDKRCMEAVRLGFNTIYTTPSKTKLKTSAQIIEVSTVYEMCEHLLNMRNKDRGQQ